MASRFALLTTIVLDASGYNKGINQVSQQTKEMASTLKEAGNGVTETLGKMGGLTSEIGASVGELAGAATGIGLVVAAISVLINYLKIAKENMDKYLESADKAKGGTGMFFEDAQTLQKETTKRARGGVTADQDIMTKSFLQLNRVQKEINAETDQAKKNELIDLRTQLFNEYQSAKLQKVINEDIKAGSTGYKNRIRIQAAARILLLEEKKLEEDKNKSLEGFIKNEGELVRLRTVILSKTTTEAEKEKAMTDYAALAKTQLDAKTSLIEREISLTEQRGKLTFTEHDSEEKILKLNADKAELGKTYNTQLLKAERDQNRILASEQKALAAKEKAQKVEADFQDTKTNLHQKVIIDEQKTEMDTALQTRTFKYMNDKKELEEKYKGHKDLEILLKDMETAYMIEMADIKQEYYDKDVEAKKKAEEKKIADEKKAKQDRIDAEQKIIDTKIGIVNTEYEADLITKKDYLQKMMDLELSNSELTEKQKMAIRNKYTKAMQQVDMENLQTLASSVQNILGSITQMQNSQKESELAAAGNSANKRAEIERRYARKAQRIAVGQALINTALAIGSALQTKPFIPMGLIAAAAAGLAGAVQVGAIMGQSFSAGGIVSGPTNALIGEYRGAATNPEVVAPLSKLQDLLGLSGGGEVKFKIEGTELVGVLNNYTRKINSYA